MHIHKTFTKYLSKISMMHYVKMLLNLTVLCQTIVNSMITMFTINRTSLSVRQRRYNYKIIKFNKHLPAQTILDSWANQRCAHTS